MAVEVKLQQRLQQSLVLTPQLQQSLKLLQMGHQEYGETLAQELLEKDWGIAADVWSCPSFNELTRDGQDCERHNMLHPLETAKVPFVTQQLQGTQGPVIASTDYMKLFADQIRQWVPVKEYKVLGTDGFGRSDSRKKLRHFFEVDRYWVVLAALEALVDRGEIEAKVLADAIAKFVIDPEIANPLDC